MLMRLIDEQYTSCPFYGAPRMTDWLRRGGYLVNQKGIARLMRKMAIQGIGPERNLSKSLPEHKKYPYLLRGLNIHYPNQVWCSDITYIRMLRGFIYPVAVMDWYSRYVLAWEVSNTMDVDFCVQALEKALKKGKPKIFNTDQGAQFTSAAFTISLLDQEIQISMDGKGRVFDNIFIERLWRSVKYEEVYLKDYSTVREAVMGLKNYFNLYNHERPHQALNYSTPAEIYSGANLG